MKRLSDNIFKYQLISLLVVVSIIMSFAGYIYYSSEKHNVEREKYNEIKAISGLKVNQLIQWRKERLSEANFFTKSLPYPNYTALILKGSKGAAEHFSKGLQGIMNGGRYENIFMLDSNGKLVYSYAPDFYLKDTALREDVRRVFKENQIIIKDFHICLAKDRVFLEFLSPIRDINNQNVIAVLVFRVEPNDYLHPLIQQWPTPSKTAETYIIRKEKDSVVYLSTLRHLNVPELSLKVSLKDTNTLAAKAVTGKMGVIEGVDYRGKKVLADVRTIPDTPWYIVSKIDQSEIYKDLNKRALLVIIISFLTILFTGATTAWMYNFRQRSTYKQLLESSDELHQSQTEFGATLYSIGDGVITTDLEGKVRQINPVAKKMTGWRERDAKGKNIDEVCQFVNEETRENVSNGVKEVLSMGLEVKVTKRVFLISKFGEDTPISAVVTPIKNRMGKILGTVMVIRNHSTDRIKRLLVETRLKLFEFATNHSLSETTTKILDEIGELMQSPIGFFHLVMPDQETINLQTWSSKTLAEFCKTNNITDHYKLSDAGVWADCIRLRRPVIHNDYDSLENKNGMPEGHAKLYREIVVPVIRKNLIVAVLGVGNKISEYSQADVELLSYLADVMWEITEAKRMEENLRENEERIRLLFNSTAEGIYGLDVNGNCTFCNKASLRLLGYSHESEFIGKNMHNLIHYKHNDGSEFPLSECKMYQAFKEGIDKHVDDEVLWKKNGESFPAEYWSYPVFKDGKVIGTEVTFLDITQRKRDENIQQVLYEIAMKSIVTQSVDELFEVVRNELGKIIDTSYLYIALHNPKTNTLRVVNSEETQSTVLREWGVEFSLSGYVLRTKEALLIRKDEFLDFIAEHNLKMAKVQADCWLGVPLIDNNHQALGVVVVKSYSDQFAYDKNSARLLEMVSHELSSVFQRGKMISDLINAKDKAEESDRLKSAFLANISHEIRTPMNGILGFLDLLSDENITNVEREKFMEMVNKSSQRLMGTINDIVEISKIESGKIEVNFSVVNISEVMDYYFDLYQHKTQSKGIELKLAECIRGEKANIITDRYKLDGIITNLLNNATKFTHKGTIEFGNYFEVEDIADTIINANSTSDQESSTADQKSSIADSKNSATDKNNSATVAGKNTASNVENSATDSNNSATVAGKNTASNEANFTTDSTNSPTVAGKNGNSIVFYVKDSGIGIPKSKQEAIFGRFIQASEEISNLYEGSGLGLSIVKAYLDALHGTIWVESEPGIGSTFYFKIPT